VKVEIIGAPMPYGMLYHKAGKIIDIPDETAKTLIKIGRVKALSSDKRSRRVYKRRDMVAEEIPAVLVQAEQDAVAESQDSLDIDE
jgi:hypothetical protein